MSEERTRHVTWRVHLTSAPGSVYGMLATDEGRARFWAESAEERDGKIAFRFPNGVRWQGAVLEREPPARFSVEYYGGSTATFELTDDGHGGTDLTLTDAGVGIGDEADVRAGWVSVLLALKAAVDFDVDVRNHDPDRTWDQGFVDN